MHSIKRVLVCAAGSQWITWAWRPVALTQSYITLCLMLWGCSFTGFNCFCGFGCVLGAAAQSAVCTVCSTATSYWQHWFICSGNIESMSWYQTISVWTKADFRTFQTLSTLMSSGWLFVLESSSEAKLHRSETGEQRRHHIWKHIHTTKSTFEFWDQMCATH